MKYSCTIPSQNAYSELGNYHIVTSPPSSNVSKIVDNRVIDVILAKTAAVPYLILSSSLDATGTKVSIFGRNQTVNLGDMHFIYEIKGFKHPRTIL